MTYRILDPRPIPFAEGLAFDDPQRDPRNCDPRIPFEGHAQPHQSAAWILVAVPTADLNPEEFILDRGVWLRRGWSEPYPHRSGLSERAVVEAMAATVRQGQPLRPIIVLQEGRLVRIIDGYHRVAANRTAQLPETLCYLLVAKTG